MRINTQFLQMQISNLVLEYPELQADEVMRADTLEAETEIKEVLTAILHANDEDEFLLTGIEARQKELREREERLQRRYAGRRALILKIMQWADLKKMELPEATLSQRVGQRKVLGDPDVSLLPEELIKITRTPDRTKIKEALLRGEAVPECTLSNAEPSLAIHPK